METVYSVMLSRAERGMADLLISVADYFYCKGAGLTVDPPNTPGLSDLFATLDARYEREVMAVRGWTDAPGTNDDLPGWLLAHCERQTALGDAQPPPELETAQLGGKL